MIKVGANIRIIPQGSYTPEELKKEFRQAGLVFTLMNIAYMKLGEKEDASLYPPESYVNEILYARLKYKHDPYNPGKYEIAHSLVVITFMVKGVKATMTRVTNNVNQYSINYFKSAAIKARANWIQHGRWG